MPPARNNRRDHKTPPVRAAAVCQWPPIGAVLEDAYRTVSQAPKGLSQRRSRDVAIAGARGVFRELVQI